MSKLVLVLNCGSSSLKFAVIDATTGDDLLSGLAECFNLDDARIREAERRERATLIWVPVPLTRKRWTSSFTRSCRSLNPELSRT